MLAQIPGHVWWEWVAFAEIDPFTPRRFDLLAGVISSTVFNVNRGKRGRTRKPKDFMPSFEPKRPQSMETLLQKVEVLNKALGGDDLRGGK